MTSAKTKRAKGQILENYVADQLIAYGIDPRAHRDGASGAGTREKADIVTSAQIDGENIGVECKNHKNAAVRDWWAQAELLEKIGYVPVVAYKLGRESLEDTKVIIRLDTFLKLLQGQNEGVCDRPHMPDGLKWKAKRAKDACHEIFKEI